jgi:hypothetical protein
MVDQILGGLFGGQDDDDDVKRQERATDFVNRFQQGEPWENISGEEALQNYKGVVQQLSPDEYESAATAALSKLSPEDREKFANFLQQGTGAQVAGDLKDPQQVAHLTNQVRQGGGGGLSSLLGGGSMDDLLGSGGLEGLLGGGGGKGGGALDSLLGGKGGAGGLLGGLFGGGDKGKSSGAGGGGLMDLINNPIVRSVLGGIAAIAIGKMSGQQGQPAPGLPGQQAPNAPRQPETPKVPNLKQPGKQEPRKM